MYAYLPCNNRTHPVIEQPDKDEQNPVRLTALERACSLRLYNLRIASRRYRVL